MRARLVEGRREGTRLTHPLVVLLAGAMVTMAPAACGGAAPAPAAGEATATAMPTRVAPAEPTAVPTAAAATGPADGQTPGPITWDLREGPYRVSDVVSTGDLLVAVGSAGMTEDAGDIAGIWTSPDGRAGAADQRPMV